MRQTSIALAASLAALVSVSAAADNIVFASGKASVPLPGTFRVTTSDEGLIALFGDEGMHRLEISLAGNLSSDRGDDDLGAQFVRQQGAKRNARVSSAANRASFMESGGDQHAQGTTYRVVHWQIGAGNCVFTMTVTAPMPMSDDLNQFLGAPLNDIIGNIGCNEI